ncbi:MAG: LarC family nickel insertion protein [Cyanobacteriota bacterium]
MITIAYFDCYSGASGDMLLGALLDNAINFDWFKKELAKLDLPNDSFKIEKTYVNRSSINTCKIDISINTLDNHHRSYKSICNIIECSNIDNKAKELSKKIFYKLAKAEAHIHNKSIDDIHFHEIGAIDSIIDIVGFSICYNSLNIDICSISPLPVGSGEAYCQHGYIPIPAPATLQILKDHNIHIKNNPNIKEECLTPTGAAILSTIAEDCTAMPDMDKIISVGYGAGNKIFNNNIISNLRFVLGLKNT